LVNYISNFNDVVAVFQLGHTTIMHHKDRPSLAGG